MSAHAVPSPRSGLRLRPLRRRSDEDLRALAASGDAGAFAELYDRHHQALYRYCRSIVRHDEDALDALHNTWANAWDALLRADRDVPVRPWLFRIAHNEAVTVVRRRRHHDDIDDAVGIGSAVLEHDVEVRERLAALQADLAHLPERQRGALLLRELCGLGHEEIAEVFGVTPAAAKQSIYEARTALQVAEEGRGMSCAEVQHLLSDGDGRVGRSRRVRAHLRACDGCRGFQASMRQRRADLALIAPPLPLAAAASVLARVLAHAQAGGGMVAPAAAGTATATSGATALGTKLGGGLAAKIAVGAAVVATAGGGAAVVRTVVDHEHHAPAGAAPAVHRTVGGGSQQPAAVHGDILGTPTPLPPTAAAPDHARGAAASAGHAKAHGRAGAGQGHRHAASHRAAHGHGHGHVAAPGVAHSQGRGHGHAGPAKVTNQPPRSIAPAAHRHAPAVPQVSRRAPAATHQRAQPTTPKRPAVVHRGPVHRSSRQGAGGGSDHAASRPADAGTTDAAAADGSSADTAAN